MASRIMHLCIAKKTLEQLDFMKPQDFILGNLAPDLSKWGVGNYDKAHFGYSTGSLKGINYSIYIEKYLSSNKFSDYALGYFSHLLSDAIWLSKLENPFIRQKQNKQELYRQGYHDMFKLNPILIKEFKLQYHPLYKVNEVIDEIELGWISELDKELKGDFAIDYIDSNMLVYPLDSVLDYIDETVIECVSAIKKIRNGSNIVDPVKYYVGI